MTATDLLAALIEEAGLRVTLDPERSIALPCVVCGTTDQPRTLLVIGYNLALKEPLRRPVCAECEAEMPKRRRPMGVRSTHTITRLKAMGRLLAFIPTASNEALADMLEWTDDFANFIIAEESTNYCPCTHCKRHE